MKRAARFTTVAMGRDLSTDRRLPTRLTGGCPAHRVGLQRFGLGILCALITSAVVGCGQGTRDAGARVDIRSSPLSTRPGPRVFDLNEWESVFEIGATAGDTTFYAATFVEADTSGAYVYDSGRYQVLKISGDGSVRWVYGGRGQGPDEFLKVRDIELDQTGRLWILDPENARVTVLLPSGNVDVRIPMRNVPHSDQLIPLSEDRAILMALEREEPLVLIDRTGKVVERLDVPWPDYSRLEPLMTQLLTSSAPRGSYFALAFRSGDGFFVFEGKKPLPYHGVFVEHLEFPVVDRFSNGNSRTVRVRPSPDAAVSLEIASGKLYVHFGGQTEERYALIDVYDLETGRYERSLVLPRAVSDVALGGGIVYAVYEDPYPVLQAWRPKDGTL